MSDTGPIPVTKDTRRLRVPYWLIQYGALIGFGLLGLVAVLILWLVISWTTWDEGAWLGLVGLIGSMGVLLTDVAIRR